MDPFEGLRNYIRMVVDTTIRNNHWMLEQGGETVEETMPDDVKRPDIIDDPVKDDPGSEDELRALRRKRLDELEKLGVRFSVRETKLHDESEPEMIDDKEDTRCPAVSPFDEQTCYCVHNAHHPGQHQNWNGKKWWDDNAIQGSALENEQQRLSRYAREAAEAREKHRALHAEKEKERAENYAVRSDYPNRVVLGEGWPFLKAATVHVNGYGQHEEIILEACGLDRSPRRRGGLDLSEKFPQALMADDCPKYRLVLERVGATATDTAKATRLFQLQCPGCGRRWWTEQ